MPEHLVDDSGIPLDPELQELEFHLCHLAAFWRGSRYNSEHQKEIEKEYDHTLKKLYLLGWDGELSFDCELPEHLMPREYLEKNRRI
jgi:hypothetical protein